MEDELTIEINGAQYTATYSVFNDTLTAIMPDGSQRYTELRGLTPMMATRTHLRAYVLSISRQINQED